MFYSHSCKAVLFKAFVKMIRWSWIDILQLSRPQESRLQPGHEENCPFAPTQDEEGLWPGACYTLDKYLGKDDLIPLAAHETPGDSHQPEGLGVRVLGTSLWLPTLSDTRCTQRLWLQGSASPWGTRGACVVLKGGAKAQGCVFCFVIWPRYLLRTNFL